MLRQNTQQTIKYRLTVDWRFAQQTKLCFVEKHFYFVVSLIDLINTLVNFLRLTSNVHLCMWYFWAWWEFIIFLINTKNYLWSYHLLQCRAFYFFLTACLTLRWTQPLHPIYSLHCRFKPTSTRLLFLSDTFLQTCCLPSKKWMKITSQNLAFKIAKVLRRYGTPVHFQRKLDSTAFETYLIPYVSG